MLTVKRNHFFKSKIFETGVNVRPQYADLPSDTSSTTILGTNASQNIYIMGTTMPDLPNYGDAEVMGGYISIYPTDIVQKDSRSPPNLTAYKINTDLTVAEGGISISSKGDMLSVYNSSPVNEIPYLEEEFEGDPANLESISRMGTNNVVTKMDAYITEVNLYDIIVKHNGGAPEKNAWKYFWKGLEKLDGQLEGTDAWGGIYTEFSGRKARISWTNSNHTAWQVTRGYKQYWFQGLKEYINHSFTELNVIQYDVVRSAAGNTETTPQANVGNTIFDDFYASRNFSNPYDASNEDPLIMSHIELSSEASLNGGQSLRFYHNWGYSPYNAILQTQLGETSNLNPQCARVSLYDIPFPSLPYDVARTTTGDESTGPVLGDTRGVVPEIRLPMNITKLSPNVLVAGKKYVALDGSSTVLPPLNSTPLSMFYGSTTSARKNSMSSSVTAPASLFEQTFLRSIIVTFSNYKPKQSHTTVDKFLSYGLDNFYRGKNYDNIVGGYVISRFGIDGALGDSAQSDCYAFPLPVSRCAQFGTYATGTSTDEYTLRNAGMAQFKGSGDYGNLDILSWGRTLISDATVPIDERLRFVRLPMNSWFTSRIFTDIYQQNNSGSFTKRIYSATSTDNPTYGSDSSLADIGKRGVPMRVIFETDTSNPDMVTMSGTTIINLDGEVVNENARNLPFLDIPFPIGDSSNSAAAIQTDSYSFAEHPELYPKHMTIWVQNYPWVSGNVRNTSGNGTYDSLFYVGDSNVTTSGAAREAELYVDSVKLLNYSPRVYNVTANNKNASLSFQPKQIQSPIATRKETSGTDMYINSWVNSGPVSYTALCHVSGSGDTNPRIVKIQDPSVFDTTFIENSALVSTEITVADGGAKIPASTEIASIDDIDTFTINQDPVGAGAATVAVTFTADGTLLPPINKADLISYDAGQNVVIGFNDDSDLPTSTDSHVTNASGYLLFNDFNTVDWSGVSADPALPNKTQTQQGTNFGGIYSQATANNAIDALGGQLVGTNIFTDGSSTSNVSGASYPVNGGNNAVTSGTALGTGTSNNFISVDGFRQKGFIKVGFSGSNAGNYGKWVKRENILLSTRITNCRDKSVKNNVAVGGYKDDLATNQIQVSDISMFNYFDPDEKYIIYLVGNTDTTASKKTGLILDRAKLPINNIITFTNLTSMADDGTTRLVSESNLFRLMVSPEKYTLTMLYDTPKTRIPRSYGSVCTVSQTPSISSLSTVSGTTLNEFIFNYTNTTGSGVGGGTGLYKNIWSLVPNPENRTIISSQDYGYGQYDEETSMGGYYFREPAFVDTFNCYKLTHLTDEPQTNLNFAVSYDTDSTFDESITIATDDFSSDSNKKPTLYIEYKDLPPVISHLSVQPTVNTLGDDYNYYNITDANLNSVTFNWDEENADDIWYRMLLVDDVPIADKYHRAITYLPLNESTTNLSAAPVGEVVAYNMTTGYSVSADAIVTVGSDVRKIPTGQGGWALQLANTTNGKVKYTGNTAAPWMRNLEEYTVVIHWTPSTADEGVEAYILTAGTPSYGTGDMQLYKDASDKIIYWLGGNVITGSSTIKCDGETPTSIILTYKKDAAKNNNRVKVYIDGVLQGKSSTTQTITAAGPLILGGFFVSASEDRGTTGYMEELVIYDKAYEVVPNSGPYVYNTVNLEDYDDPDTIQHSAKLIAADYHNFRGTSKLEIGMSQSVQWGATIV